MDAPELKPCPFCGGADITVFGPVGWYCQFGITHSCRVFFGGSGNFTIGGKTRHEAITAWNRRADLPPTLADALALPEIAALVEAARRASQATTNDGITGRIYTYDAIALQRALTAIKKDPR